MASNRAASNHPSSWYPLGGNDKPIPNNCYDALVVGGVDGDGDDGDWRDADQTFERQVIKPELERAMMGVRSRRTEAAHRQV